VTQDNQFDSLTPLEMAQKAEEIGVRKANLPTSKIFMLSLLAGAFIALGAAFSTTILAGSSALPYGLARLLAGLALCLGLILVIIGGAELFTGNSLIIIARASGKIDTSALLRNWVIAYLGNFVGSICIAVLMFLAQQYTNGAGSVGEIALKTATSKVQFGFVQAIALGIICNMLVCLAILLTYSARTTSGKIMAIIFPITAFVAIGSEHSVANMFFIPYGLLIQQYDPAFVAGLGNKVSLESLSWSAFFLKNLLPVTIGNIIGGALLVGMLYWLIYLRGARNT
jgi:formate transporter